MIRNKNYRIMSFILAFLMILGPLANISSFAQEEAINVDVRVEGNTYTIVDEIQVNLKDKDLSQYGIDKDYEDITAFHALISAIKEGSNLDLKSKEDFDFSQSEYGILLTTIDSLKMGTEELPASGWGYMVNNESPSVGIDSYKLKDGDSVVVYYQENWDGFLTSSFDKELLEIRANDQVKLKLTGKGFDENFNPIEVPIVGADILSNGKSAGVKTDANGEFTISFSKEGVYNLSAVRRNKNGEINISRPYAKALVEKSEETPSLDYKDQDKISTWALKDVMEASQNGFVAGDDLGNFNPQNDITRAEFIRILIEALDFEMEDNLENPFTDVAEGQWFYKYVVNGSKLGLVSGYDGKFMPGEKISRQEMALMIVNAIEKKSIDLKTSEIEDFKDKDKIGFWAEEAVEKITSGQIMFGADGKFDPLGRATREMATSTLMRVFRLSEDQLVNPETPVEPEIPVEPEKPEDIDVRDVIEKTGEKLYSEIENPQFGTIGGDWTVLSLARGNIDVPDGYYNKHYDNVVKILEEKQGKLHSVKYTEYSRTILSLTSTGRDVKDVGGYNLLEPLADFNTVIKQGINGPIFALIAFDSYNYEIPLDESVEVQTSRDHLIDFILEREIEGGGWDLRKDSTKPYADITAMALQALAPYYNQREDVKLAVDRGVKVLSDIQNEKTGGYYSWGNETSESVAQVVTALSALGIDAHKDERFIKNGISALENLLSYEDENGGFYHIKSTEGEIGPGEAAGGEVNPMATDQAMYALVAYDRFAKGQNSLYDMTDVK